MRIAADTSSRFRIAAALGAAALLALTVSADAQGRPKKVQKTDGDAPQGEKSEPAQEYETPFPLKMTWNLRDLNGKAPPAEATLLIDENLRGSGLSGCNTYSASLYPVKGHKLAMGPVAQTKKSCPQDVMAFERAFLTILHTGPTWEQTGSTLTIKSQAGALVFNRGL